MAVMTPDELAAVGAADEIEISPLRADGAPRPAVTIWVVRVGDALYVRSARGERGGWWRHCIDSGRARIRAGSVDVQVGVERVGDELRPQIDATYRQKYERYGGAYVGSVTNDETAASTLRLIAG